MADPVAEIEGRRLARQVEAEFAAREVLLTQPSRLVGVAINITALIAVSIGVYDQPWPLLTRVLLAVAVLSSVALGIECFYLRRQVDALIQLVRKGAAPN